MQFKPNMSNFAAIGMKKAVIKEEKSKEKDDEDDYERVCFATSCKKWLVC